MNSRIESKTVLVVPPALVRTLDHLVTDFALMTKEEPKACRRAVEIAVIQRGIAAVREDLKK